MPLINTATAAIAAAAAVIYNSVPGAPVGASSVVTPPVNKAGYHTYTSLLSDEVGEYCSHDAIG